MKYLSIIGNGFLGLSIMVWAITFDFSGGIMMIFPFIFFSYLLFKSQEHDDKNKEMTTWMLGHKKAIETIQKQLKSMKKEAKAESVTWNKDFKALKKEAKDLEKEITDIEKIVTKNRNYEATLKTLTRKIKGETTRDTLIQESAEARKLRIRKRKEMTKNILNENKNKEI